jgi:hypothetical protein
MLRIADVRVDAELKIRLMMSMIGLQIVSYAVCVTKHG